MTQKYSYSIEEKRDEKEEAREEVLIWAEKLRDWLKDDKDRTIWPV